MLKDEEIFLERDGRKMPVFISGPDSNDVLPGLIIVHEIFGLTDHIKDLAQRFAKLNMRAYAPDLFSGVEGAPLDSAGRENLDLMREVWSKIPDNQFISDLRAVLVQMQRSKIVSHDKIGAIGYCMGGAIALMFASESPELSWIADYYGRIKYPSLTKTKPKHPIDYVGALQCPMLGIFAGIDPLIPKSDIEDLSKQLEVHGKSHKIKVYPRAPHAFFNDRRPHYNAEAATDAWQITLAFINSSNSVLKSKT